MPFGLVQAGADTGNGSWQYCSGYRYEDKTICGFTQTHLNGTGCPDLGDLRILPMAGNGERETGNWEREFKVIARNLSRENKYVKSVTLNGQPVTDWKIRHADVMRGGELIFEMEAL